MGTAKKYRLLKDFDTPCKRICKGTIKTIPEWVIDFPDMWGEYFDIKKDWFEEIKEEPSRIEVNVSGGSWMGNNPQMLLIALTNEGVFDEKKLPEIKKLLEDYLNAEGGGLPEAIETLCNQLKKDKSEGSYYYGWQANIAMAFFDEFYSKEYAFVNTEHMRKVISKVANNAAQNFLNQLILERTPAPIQQSTPEPKPFQWDDELVAELVWINFGSADARLIVDTFIKSKK